MRNQRGFTFIEILIATTIMMILVAIVTVSFQGANRNGRDIKRTADLEQAHGALEKYRLETGTYPGTVGQSDSSADGLFLSTLQPSYMGNLNDPSPATGNYYYTYQNRSAAGCSYVLIAKMEISGHAKFCPSACGVTNAVNDYCVSN